MFIRLETNPKNSSAIHILTIGHDYECGDAYDNGNSLCRILNHMNVSMLLITFEAHVNLTWQNRSWTLIYIYKKDFEQNEEQNWYNW